MRLIFSRKHFEVTLGDGSDILIVAAESEESLRRIFSHGETVVELDYVPDYNDVDVVIK